MFSKLFLKNFKINLRFLKKKNTQTSFLKAPSRHKKFFHQVCYEMFILKIFIKYFFEKVFDRNSYISLFENCESIFKEIGSNTLTRTKFILNNPLKLKITFF